DLPPGTYRVEISGDFPRIYFANTGDKSKIREVSQWGYTKWESMRAAFWGATDLEITATDLPNLSKVKDMAHMFRGVTGLTGAGSSMGSWDVSGVENMSRLFEGATNFNLDISGWDVSSVEAMDLMFYGARSFNQPIGNWTDKTANVKNMH